MRLYVIGATRGCAVRGCILWPGGGHDHLDAQVWAGTIARCVRLAEELGATHLSTTGASPRGKAGALAWTPDTFISAGVDTIAAIRFDGHYRSPAGSQLRRQADGGTGGGGSHDLPRYTEEAYIYLCGLLGRKL